MNKKLIGFVVIVVSLTLLGVWEFWGREYLSYENILVLKEPLDANTTLAESHFAVKKVENPTKEALKVADKTTLVGMKTAQFVADNTELRKEYFIEEPYQVGGETGKGIMAISMDWLLSYPQTMMRGDDVTVYKGSNKIGECIIAHVRDSSNNEVHFSQGDRNSGSGTAIYLEVIADISTLINISTEAAKGNGLTIINLQ